MGNNPIFTVRIHLMVTTHRISADLCIEDFELIAIHTDLQDYSLAYHLNSEVKLRLARREKDLHFQEGIWFSVFEWMDEITDSYWYLIKNECMVERDDLSIGLFDNEMETISKHLIEERKEVDYFLKIETENQRMVQEEITKRIKSIASVVTAYTIEPDTLKSKKNLIF